MVSSVPLTTSQTTWTLNRCTKPFTWDTKYSSTPLLSGDPFAFDHLVRGERILEITALHDACATRPFETPPQWNDENATGVETQPPPEFPILEVISSGEEVVVSSTNEPTMFNSRQEDSLSLSASDQSKKEDKTSLGGDQQDVIPSGDHEAGQSDDDDDTYPDDWDDDLFPPDEPLSDEPIPLRTFLEPDNNTRAKHRLDTIKKFVIAQLQLPCSSRVDTIVFEDPLPNDFLAIDGLTFKHLELRGGLTEEIDLTPVAQLSTSWSTIESVLLNSVCVQLVYDRRPHSGSVKEQWKAIPSTIKTLQLNLSTSSFDFRHPNGGYRSLQNLKLVDNSAIDLFCKAWRQLPNFTTQIQILHLVSTNGCDFSLYTVEDLRRRIKTCTGIKTLVLALHMVHEGKEQDIDTTMADCIPASVENLSFHFTQSDAMLKDLDTWIERAHDPEWLPHLRCIRLKPDAEQQGYRYEYLPESERRTPYVRDPRFEAKIQTIYQHLSQRTPVVQAFEIE